MLGKDHHFANRRRHPEPAIVRHEIPAQAFGGDVVGDGLWVDGAAGPLDRVLIQVGGVDLQRQGRGRAETLAQFLEQDGQREGFFSRRTGGHPGAQRPPGRRVVQQQRQDLRLQTGPGVRVAKKARHAYQEFLIEHVDFLRVLAQHIQVVGDAVDLMNAHAPLDPSVQGALLVLREIRSGLRPEHEQDLFERALTLDVEYLPDLHGSARERCEQSLSQFVGGGDDVGQRCIQRAAGHAVELGRPRFLYRGQSAFFLDVTQSRRTVRAHARQNDADPVV